MLMSRHFLKVDLKFVTLVATAGIIFLWLSLAPLWLFSLCENKTKDGKVENSQLPQWAKGAEKIYSHILFMVDSKDHKWLEKTKDQNKWWFQIPIFLIGVCLPGLLILLVLACFESYSLMALILKVVFDIAFFCYLSVGSFLLWWAWLF